VLVSEAKRTKAKRRLVIRRLCPFVITVDASGKMVSHTIKVIVINPLGSC
jgi:hypothetical protein